MANGQSELELQYYGDSTLHLLGDSEQVTSLASAPVPEIKCTVTLGSGPINGFP